MIHLVHFKAYPHSDPNVTDWKLSLVDAERSDSFNSQFMVEPTIVRSDIHNVYFDETTKGSKAWHDLALEELDPVSLSKTVFLINKAVDARASEDLFRQQQLFGWSVPADLSKSLNTPSSMYSVQDYRRPNYIGCSMASLDGSVSGVLILTETEYHDAIPPPTHRLDSTPWRIEPSLT